jgi:hypothetical protein
MRQQHLESGGQLRAEPGPRRRCAYHIIKRRTEKEQVDSLRVQASKNRTTFLPFARYLRSLYPLDTRIAAQFQALPYCTLDGTDHVSPEEQASMIRRYLGWRNPHADDEKLPEIVARAKVALSGTSA